MPGGVEIERKFLLDRLPGGLERHPAQMIEQGYLAITDDGIEVRIRRRAERSFLTIKAGAGHVRLEEEMEIDQRRFESLWPLTEGRRVEKTRYLVPGDGGATVEIDVYHGRLDGLVTSEIEFESVQAATAFDAPGWLGHEITGDERYMNRELATRGAPPRYQPEP